MTKTLHKASVYLLIGGITSLFFGFGVLAFPAMSLLCLIRLFAGYMVIKGFALSAGAWQTRLDETHWQFLLWYGILNILTGIAAFVYPDITLVILGFIVSINLLAGGILQIAIAIHLHKEIKQGIWLVLSGIIALVAGFYIYLIPRIGPIAILDLIALSALIVGVFLTVLSLKAVGWHIHINKHSISN